VTKTYEELEEELAYFKQALKVEQSEKRLAKLSKVFGFTPSQAKLALALYDRAGGMLTKGFALDILYPNPDEAAEQKIIDVFICKIRTKLIYRCGDQKPINTVWGRGYQMSPAGMAIFAQALGEAPLHNG
jgi:DNA-binding response OmpR family regulator